MSEETTMPFDFPKDAPHIIKVIGVGGGGGNAVNHMYREGIHDVTFVVCNTDNQALDESPVPIKLQLGSEGLGAGNRPERAKAAAEESMEDIKLMLNDGCKMAFITAGMGGGTGTGAAPIIAKTAKEMGILTVGIVTIPFLFEGNRKIDQALDGVEEMSNKMLEAIGLATAYDWAGWVSGISTMGLVTAIFGLVFVIVYFILYFQFLMRGLEILILRVGIPLACVGLIDNDKGVFKPYMSKFFQSALSVVIQVSLAKLGVGLMMNMHIFWGVACMILAVRTPKFLQDFLITTGGGGSGAIVNNAYHSVRLVQMVKGMGK